MRATTLRFYNPLWLRHLPFERGRTAATQPVGCHPIECVGTLNLKLLIPLVSPPFEGGVQLQSSSEGVNCS